MKKLKLALMGVCLAWTAQAAYADDCYSDSLMAYVDSRIPSGNQVERRWEKIKAALLEQDGGITLERAEEILANRKARGFGLERMDEVVAALKCLAAQPDPEPEVVIVPPEPEDPPQPLNSDPMPQQVDNTSLRTYFHVEPLASTSNEYRINEDDHWEADLILHYESNQDLPGDPLALSGIAFCINQDIWGGPDHWHNGPITLPGFTEVADKTALPTILPQHGLWRCTDGLSVEPNTTILDDNGDGDTNVEVVYRAKVRTRDNNVVEDDFRVTDLQFRVLDTFSGSTIWRTETETMVDRDSWWRMNLEDEAFPDTHNTYCLGTGSAWVQFTPLRCKDLRPSKYLDRAPLVGGSCDKGHSDYVVRADVSEADWLPDSCFSTKVVPKIPPTPPNSQPTTFDNTSLPIIEEDDVSYVRLHKVNGKWTVSLSRPVMVTDHPDLPNAYRHTSHGLTLILAWRKFTNGTVNVLIPAENGIVSDGHYLLHDLRTFSSIDPLPIGISPNGNFGERCGQLSGYGFGNAGYKFRSGKHNNYVFNGPLSSHPDAQNGLDMTLPPNNTDLCN